VQFRQLNGRFEIRYTGGMVLPRWVVGSLARKISLLFGAAVLLTIVVTLAFPRLQMNALNEHALLLEAKQVASIAHQTVDLGQHDWTAAQEQLLRHWPSLARELALSPQPPTLIRDDARVGPGFQTDAMERLRRNPEQRYYWRIQDEGRTFRFAMAVRGSPADPYPQVLRGLIDVRLPIPWAPAVWNAVVTGLAGASGAVLAIVVFYLVTQRLVLRPVQALRHVAEKVTAGDITVRASIPGGDEFHELSQTFNDMLQHLGAAREEQEKINRSLDIRLGELAETNVALYEANRLKGEFLTNVTHELRTPLVSIIGFAELLRDATHDPAAADPTRVARYCENILTSGRNLLEIINDLLDLAKIEAGKMELHLSAFSIADLCNDMMDFVRPLADKRQQQLTLQLMEDPPRCHTDSGKLKQILFNLLSNAIKFTPPGGSVELGATKCGDGRIRLSVSDTGPGIPAESRGVIFEKFRQLDSSRTREYEGTGLGLAITKELVQMLDGSIRLEDREPPGCTFTVELPTTIKREIPRPRVPLSAKK
jgi:signal transduction histidine kinase